METKSCEKCIACAPNDGCAGKSEFVFSEDFECLMMSDTFPGRCDNFCDPDPFWKYEKDGGSIIR